MAVKINGTNNTIDMGGGSLVNNSNINGLIVPDESGSFITSERDDSHVPVPTNLHLLSGDVSVTDETVVNGFGINIYTGTGAVQNITTGVDTDTQWGNDSSKRYGGLIISKSKSQVGDWSMVDTVRGASNVIFSDLTQAQVNASSNINSFNSSGFGVGTSTGVNTTSASYLAMTFQTTHRRSGNTNHGQPIIEHYNPSTGFFIIQYTGSGSLGHLITHSLGRKISFAMWKNLGTTDSWICEGSTLGIGSYIVMPGSSAVNPGGSPLEFTDKHINMLSTVSDSNVNGNTYIMYGFADAYKDKSNKLIGNFETGTYVGTGADRNFIKTKAKPLLVLTRMLDYSVAGQNEWSMVDTIRGGGKRLFIHLSSAEDPSNTMDIYKEGFSPTGNTGTNNTLGVKHFYLVVYDNDNNSGKSKYIKTADTSVPKVNNGIMSFSEGIDTNGLKNSTISKNENINSLNLKPGKNYVYCKKDGSVLSTPYKPSVDVYDGFGEFLNSDTNKWYNNISVFKDDFSNGIGTWVADEVNNNANIANIITLNGELLIVNNGAYYGAARNTFNTIIGKKYKFSISVTSNNVGSVGCMFGSSIKGVDLYNYGTFIFTMTGAGKFTGTFIATSTTTHITLYNSATASQISTWDNICVYPITDDDIVDVSNANEIVDGRTYFNTMIYCDHNGKIVYEEELPKTTYLNSTVINNLESVKGNAITNSTTDNTPGKLLKVGDFGIGGKAIVIPTNNLNSCLSSGSYVCPSNALNLPLVGSGWLQVYENSDGSAIVQVFTAATTIASIPNKVFIRNIIKATNFFSPWREQASVEYGSFTPEVVGGSTNGVSTHSVQLGQYTKIGRWVHFSLYVAITATTGVGELVIRGLPYASDNASNFYACTLAYADQLAYTGTPSAYINPNASYIVFRQSSPNTAIQYIPIDTNFGIMVSGSYKTASL